MTGLVPLLRRRRNQSSLSQPCEDMERRQLSASQEEGPRQEPTMLASWSWTFSLQNCGKCLPFKPPSTVFCYGAPRKLRQMENITLRLRPRKPHSCSLLFQIQNNFSCFARPGTPCWDSPNPQCLHGRWNTSRPREILTEQTGLSTGWTSAHLVSCPYGNPHPQVKDNSCVFRTPSMEVFNFKSNQRQPPLK